MNKDFTLSDRAGFYSKEFPKYPPLVAWGDWLYGYWMIGNNYRGSGYHGSYPPSYVRRVMSLFPDAGRILHLFSGSLGKEVKGDRFDIRANMSPDILGDANYLSEYITGKYDLIMADPPYTNEDALKYGNPMISRNKVLKECVKVLEPGGFLVWLDMAFPMFRKDEVKLVGTISYFESDIERDLKKVGENECPVYIQDGLMLKGAVGLMRSTNHRIRGVLIFQRL